MTTAGNRAVIEERSLDENFLDEVIDPESAKR